MCRFEHDSRLASDGKWQLAEGVALGVGVTERIPRAIPSGREEVVAVSVRFALLFVAIRAIVGGVGGAALANVAEGGPVAIAVSAAVGVALGVLLGTLQYRWTNRARAGMARVRTMLGTSAVTRAGFAVEDRQDGIALQPWASDGPVSAAHFLLAADRDGVSLWTLNPESPTGLARVPWSDVEAFEVAPPQAGRAGSRRIRLIARRDGVTAVVSLTPRRIEAGQTAPADHGDILEFLAAAQAAKSGVHASTPTPTPTPALTPSVGQLEGGLTSWHVSRLLKIWVLGLSSATGAAIIFGSIVLGLPAPGLAIGFALVAAQLFYVWSVAWLLRRANARERRAGYTTLQRVHLDLEQRHPTSGAVIRRAGERPIGDDEFRRLLEA